MILALHGAMTSSGPETMNIGAPIIGNASPHPSRAAHVTIRSPGVRSCMW
jgi:hypothetical protein